MRFYLKQIFLLVLIVYTNNSLAQIGGEATYQFLNLPNNARIAALGGNNLTLSDNDLNIVYHNPAQLNNEMDNNFIFNYVSYLSDIKFGYVAYAKEYEKIGTIAYGLHFINYGNFTEADESGVKLGTFTAGEYALNFSYAKPIDSSYTIGVSLKPILSNLEIYVSAGIAADIGISYFNKHENFTAALVLKNIGKQLKPYHEGNFEPLPFDIQLGITKKLAHAPFRFSITAHHLYRWDLTYEIPQTNTTTLDEPKNKNFLSDNFDKALRHLIIGIEFIPVNNFGIYLGYNHQRARELSLDTKAGLTGFSFGFGLKISKFYISYGWAMYHLAGASNHFSFGINFNEFYD